jgi:EAL domain-containing protein (putative c-di-GMP-specific phosphodiesterase class I)
MSVPEKILRLRPTQTDADEASIAVDAAFVPLYAPASLAEGMEQLDAPTVSGEARQRLDLEEALRRAIDQQQFVLHYQPQLDLRTGDILSVEALIRWDRPDAGLVMPSEFIAFAEERELISAIDEWVLATSSEQSLKWDRAGLPPFGVAVNISASQFHRSDFVTRVAGILRKNQVATNRIELEITEDVIMHDCESTIEILHSLHDLGLSLSIDDFGTGYSSLSYLRRFPIDEIKIDRSFVADMCKDDGAARIVRGIIQLAHSLNLQVIAEGVETSEQLKRLIELRCDRAQGYLISRPVAAAKLECFLAEWPRRWKTVTG